MGESAATGAAADGGEAPDGSTASHEHHDEDHPVVSVADKGDIILDLVFENSKETLRRSRKEIGLDATTTTTTAGVAHKSGAGSAGIGIRHGVASSPVPLRPGLLKPRVRVAYRVKLDALKKHSKYFANLLANAHFREAKLIADAHAKLLSMKIKPAEASVADLPRITIVDDDEATKAAGRELAFEDMLRILHQQSPKATKVTMSYVATIAIIADRFDCVAAVSRSLNHDVKFRWPVTSSKPLQDEQGRATTTEQVIRQKILVSWLLGQPMRLHQASRELILRGSSLWSVFLDADSDVTAAWWNLPEGLEHELQYRRECILNTIASVQRHFLQLYSSRERQCQLGYDSSAACDSFQLGQMLKFLLSKKFLSLVDFSPASLDSIPDTSLVDIEELLTALKQCPNYQVDKHHTNCGLRIRIDPILDYIRTMVSASSVSITYTDWKKHRADVSWVILKENNRTTDDDELQKFSFTRSLANDQRLRYEGAIYADGMAKTLFTADHWDWTPET